VSGSTEGYANEPIRGLPGHLPAGEHIVWQGAPDWKRLALTAFHVRGVALYFGLILAAAAFTGAGATGLALTVAAGVAAVAVLGFIAWLSARSTVYTLTNRRVVFRIGIALPTCINVPLKIVDNASMKLHADGTADIPLQINGSGKMGWMMLWPHARPWQLSAPEPMLRAVPEGARVAAMLSRTLAEAVPDGRRLVVAGEAPAPGRIGEVQAA
jgi:hypothetical protein